ncbi:MAG: hypothetical protein ACT6QS_00360 [Flavobacteriales bacterium]
MESTKAKEELCCLCGVRTAKTKEHVPPKGIFVPPRPSNLITVPACWECNNGSSDYDERFKAYLGLHVARFGPEGEKVFRYILRSINHNRKLKREVIDKIKPVYLTTKSGIIHDKKFGIEWDHEAHDKIIEKIVKGLFYHCFNEIVAGKATIQVQWFRTFPDLRMELDKATIGDGAFTYWYRQAEDAPLASIWAFEFYNGHWAGGYTLPILEKHLDL